jgi:hypothetical protein
MNGMEILVVVLVALQVFALVAWWNERDLRKGYKAYAISREKMIDRYITAHREQRENTTVISWNWPEGD